MARDQFIIMGRDRFIIAVHCLACELDAAIAAGYPIQRRDKVLARQTPAVPLGVGRAVYPSRGSDGAVPYG